MLIKLWKAIVHLPKEPRATIGQTKPTFLTGLPARSKDWMKATVAVQPHPLMNAVCLLLPPSSPKSCLWFVAFNENIALTTEPEGPLRSTMDWKHGAYTLSFS